MELDESGKTVNDLIAPGMYVTPDGDVVGDIKYATGLETLFPGQADGHFFPVTFGSEYQGKELTMKGRTDGDRTATLGEDLLLIVRLENLKGDTLTIECEKKNIVTFNFATANKLPQE